MPGQSNGHGPALQRVEAALERVGSTREGQKWQCPAHDDRDPSLSLTAKDDRVLVHCHGGCKTLNVLEELGLEWSNLFDEPARGKNWKTSTLRKVGATVNSDGRVQLGAVRYEPGAQPKSLAVPGSKRDLWPAPEEVIGGILYVCEGEPDAVSADQVGLPAVGVPGASKWDPAWAKRIAKGRDRVVILPDADKPGRDAAKTWAAAIAEYCADVRIVDLHSTRDDGADFSDWVSTSTTDEDYAKDREAIEAVAEAAERVKAPPLNCPTQGTQGTHSSARAMRVVSDVSDVSDNPTPGTAELLDEIGVFLRRFVVLPSDEVRDLLSLWVLHTHAFEAAWATPYLRITSAAPGSGKTLLLEVLTAIVRNGWHAVNPSVAVLYRKIDRAAPTLLLDEMDNYPLDDRRDALSVLNAGYKAGAKVDRCRENGDLESFSAYCPKAYAGLDNRALIDTLLSRSITIRLDAKLATEKAEMWIAPIAEPEAQAVRELCEQWVAGRDMEELRRERPDLPDFLQNRAAEVWWALLVLADTAGENWPVRARQAAAVLTAGADATDDQSDQVALLHDCRAAFTDRQTLTSVELVDFLNRLDESPWGARRRGEGLDARSIARLLRPFKIRSKTVRSGERLAKGYRLEQFDDAFARHLPPDVAAVADVAANSGRGGWVA